MTIVQSSTFSLIARKIDDRVSDNVMLDRGLDSISNCLLAELWSELQFAMTSWASVDMTIRKHASPRVCA